MGRATQGVRVMNLRDDDRVSAVAPVVESSADIDEGAPIAGSSENGHARQSDAAALPAVAGEVEADDDDVVDGPEDAGAEGTTPSSK